MNVEIKIDGTVHKLSHCVGIDPCGTCSLKNICEFKETALCNYFQQNDPYSNFQKVEKEP